ncbi:hypothetical protein E2C01_065949 [Portunus trituberculatus]|uniref:Uncharacterized protein n=1 Tax=Portunus trituberculatus TaxID=210409 RepID=A0A5B7HNH8_PORTR|nr:hypothetical protein [Portunus trituberculatus]
MKRVEGQAAGLRERGWREGELREVRVEAGHWRQGGVYGVPVTGEGCTAGMHRVTLIAGHSFRGDSCKGSL